VAVTLITRKALGAGAASPNAVTITRDSAGVAQIVARNFAALGYGEGYVFAQDNLCTFANDIVTLEGERSRYFGPNSLAIDYSAGTSATNLQSDEFWRYIQATGLVQRKLAAAPPNGLLPQVRQIYTGWVAGYNRYLASGELSDPTCKGKPWVRPITLTDMLLRGVQITTAASGQQFLTSMVGAVPPATSAAADARAAVRGRITSARARSQLAALKVRFDAADQANGSNGIGLGADATRAGTGMVLANPHFPWRGTERFWMAQLDVPGSYDVEGGTLEGFPLIGIGFNRNLAWTHTNATDERFVLYQLKLVPGDPTSYLLNGKPVKMGRVTVSVHLRGATGHHTFYTTRWGPVVSVPAVPFNAYVWNPQTAYALYDATDAVGPRAADQYFRMGQATSVRDLYEVEAKWLAIPVFNTIAADDHGNAYYGDVGATPAVSQSEINSCLPPGIPTLVFQQANLVTLDGSRSACAPANEPGTPEKGIFSAKQLPHLFRRDYVENSNDSYWLANPSHALTGFSPIIGLIDVPQLRTAAPASATR
jgi:acyl-homoserine-lactone acylase